MHRRRLAGAPFRSPSACRSASWSRQIDPGRFIDQLSGDGVALGNLLPLSVAGGSDRLIQRGDEQCRQFFSGGARIVVGLTSS
jgi:hypothetical protein